MQIKQERLKSEFFEFGEDFKRVKEFVGWAVAHHFLLSWIPAFAGMTER